MLCLLGFDQGIDQALDGHFQALYFHVGRLPVHLHKSPHF